LIDHYRQQKGVAGLEMAEPAVETLRPLDEQIIQGERMTDLHRAMNDLPPNYREVIILRIILAMSTTVVADWMNLTEGATRVLLHRALASLRGKLQEPA
jgi:RNA polymerase sigma-70 factor (ECF subfamily)